MEAGSAAQDQTVPTLNAGPEEIWAKGSDEGIRRLGRGPAELTVTGLIGGFDVMLGVALLMVTSGALATVLPPKTAAVIGSLAFGIGFVFITVGRSELFTENFLIPLAALFRERVHPSRLARMWALTLVGNLAGLAILAAILSKSGVLDHNALVAGGRATDVYARRDALAAFLSAIAAGGVMTLWTWLNTAASSQSSRVMIALIVGFALAAPTLNHVVVSTGDMLFGLFGGQSHANYADLAQNFGLALAGNLVGGIGFVTLTRLVQVSGN